MSTAKQDSAPPERAAQRAAWAGKIQGHLSKHGSPRNQFALMAGLTGGAGFLASWGLLHLGLRALWIRYSLSVVIAYLVFLFLLWIWLEYTKRRLFREEISPEEPGVPSPGESAAQLKTSETGWEVVSSLFDGLEIADGLGILLLVLAAIAVVLSIMAGVILVIATAPALLAEVLLDALLSAGLYRRLKGVDTSHWLESSLRRTWKPFLAAFITFVAAGLILHAIDPHAVSIVDFWKHLRQGHH